MSINRDSLMSAKKALITVDFLSSLEASELFSNSLVGKTFELIDLFTHKTQKTASGDVVRLVKFQRTGKINQWYLSSFLKNAMVSSAELNVDCPTGLTLVQLLQQHDKLPSVFTIESFVASNDSNGNPLYSLRVYSESKVRSLLKGMMDSYLEQGWSDAKGEAIAKVRANSATLFIDELCDDQGKLTKENEDKYRLGTLKLRVAEFV